MLEVFEKIKGESRRRIVIGLAVFVALSTAAAGQERARPADDRRDRPTEHGIRFTPEMARSMADLYVRSTFQARYELDDSRVDEASENVARRLMQMAHRFDEEGFHVNLENFVGQMMKSQSEQSHRGPLPGMTPEMGRAMGESLGPIMPTVRQMMRGVAQDLRPMLSPRQQLKFAAEMMAADTAMDTFEQTMKRWAEGEVDPYGDPFQDPEERRSRMVEQAEMIAQSIADQMNFDRWERYVEQAKEFYAFDDAQAAAADSVLREAIAQGERILENPAYRDRIQDNRMLATLLRQLMMIEPAHPLSYDLERAYTHQLDSFDRIATDLKRRVDGIATRGQRQTAMARIAEHLTEAGFTDAVLETQPAATHRGAPGQEPEDDLRSDEGRTEQ